tara:strand:- start:248 stop:469 length:222 start_codon:yes stop_codon:yes gene_type:complete
MIQSHKPVAKMLEKFYAKYSPEGELQRKEFIKQFRKLANLYAGVQGIRIAKLEKENSELRKLLLRSNIEFASK